jgi:hypothetical protein
MGNYYGRRAQNNEKVFQGCLNALDVYEDSIPGYPGMTLIVEHPQFLELMQRTADQDALWVNRPERIIQLLTDSIENRGQCFLNKSLPIKLQLVDIFLRAAAQKGHHTFLNSRTVLGRRTLLGQAVQENNLACAQKILEYKPSLHIECYCQKTGQWHYLLKTVCLDFGPQSEMVQLLRAHGATLKPEDKYLLMQKLS